MMNLLYSFSSIIHLFLIRLNVHDSEFTLVIGIKNINTLKNGRKERGRRPWIPIDLEFEPVS